MCGCCCCCCCCCCCFAGPSLAVGFHRRQEQDIVVLLYSQIKVKDAKEKVEDGCGELVAWCYSDRGCGKVGLISI